jgi:hypothetical protein
VGGSCDTHTVSHADAVGSQRIDNRERITRKKRNTGTCWAARVEKERAAEHKGKVNRPVDETSSVSS